MGFQVDGRFMCVYIYIYIVRIMGSHVIYIYIVRIEIQKNPAKKKQSQTPL